MPPMQLLPDSREGLYYSVDFGTPPQQVKVIFLDTRWNRDPHCIPSLATQVPMGAGLSCLMRWTVAGILAPFLRLFPYTKKRCMEASLLGQDQWNWLQKELESSQAQLHVLVSSIQVLTTNPVVESWGHFESERTRLLRMLLTNTTTNTRQQQQQQRKVVPTLVVSGDVHYAEWLDPLA
eukprot:CAMPEP_0116847666 /NCGR_PEP_ID=MMETSP0418-20121206/14559_1 /TAXON_ID=1158023 /ORGANISM="Astrosyne radiata, Strain 13vi08-1A" /LENGTH=178 /DNA_ID=CAMNT_0004479133 /DNA_START=44 /DNA_END=577 /DNA_ORIENTATION=-